MSKDRYCPDCGSMIRNRARSCDICGLGKGWGVREPIDWETEYTQQKVGWLPEWLERDFARIEKLYGGEQEIPIQFCCHLCRPHEVNFIDDSFVCKICNDRICDYHQSVKGVCMSCNSN